MDEPPQPLPAKSRPSTTPSWVLLGFVLGALFVWALPHPEIGASTPAPKASTVVLERPKFSDIEAVFATWGKYAVWYHDLTEVALWDVDKKEYSICYEVLREGDVFYFRSIPHLTRPILTHGVGVQSPLRYTETEEMRQQWLKRDVSTDLDSVAPPDLPKRK